MRVRLHNKRSAEARCYTETVRSQNKEQQREFAKTYTQHNGQREKKNDSPKTESTKYRETHQQLNKT